MKFVYRILILLAIFAGSLVYFGANMDEKVFSIEKKTMTMAETTLPYISLLVEGQEINLLHGYCSSLDELTVRESITPLTKDQHFSVIITENDSNVKKVKYEVIQLEDSKLFEEGEINAIDQYEGYKLARINLKEELIEDTEYALRITLITNQSKRIYFYTRVKTMGQTFLTEKLQFVNEFHEATFHKDSGDIISKYLEKPVKATSSYANISINDSFDYVTYGTLKPQIIYTAIPTITEIAKDTASIYLNFIISVQTSTGLEYYSVKENYRFLYSKNRCYLYDYNRSMESIFDINLTSLTKSEFKLGITSQTDMEIFANKDNTVVAFVRNHALWSYSLAEPKNTMTEVFSFYQDKTDFIRDTYYQHDIRILNMDDSGNLDFIVYGYMNRGEYEGRVGIVLYHYDKLLGRVEEQIYIPINTTYELLKEQMGSFVYRNSYDVFYIHIFDTIYSYNFTTKTLRAIAENVTEDGLVFSREGKFISYQSTKDGILEESIHVLDLEDGSIHLIHRQNTCLKLLGLIDQNIIYGSIQNGVSTADVDGTKLFPMNEVYITSSLGVVKKEYSKEGYYIVDAIADKNVVEIKRVIPVISDAKEYSTCESDYILNTATQSTRKQTITKRVTDMMLTEYYLALNTGLAMNQYPALESTVNTIISEDTTVRINQVSVEKQQYIAYAFGEIVTLTLECGEAIQKADDSRGIVLDNNGKTIWERGAKTSKASIGNITKVYESDSITSLQACLKMMLTYKNSQADTTMYQRNTTTVQSYLQNNINSTIIKAQGITLDEVQYFIYKQSPVITFKENGDAVLLIEYDSTGITMIDPVLRLEKKLTKKEASVMFERAENSFITYVD